MGRSQPVANEVVVQVCIYTTNRTFYLNGMLFRQSPKDHACFYSAKKWAKAQFFLGRNGDLPLFAIKRSNGDADELDRSRCESLPILIREDSTDNSDEFACTFLADLVEIWFAFPNELEVGQRQVWLQERLWLQRDVIKVAWNETVESPWTEEERLWLQREVIKHNKDSHFKSWREQFEAWELDCAMKAETKYIIRNLRRIEPLPLPKLMKVDGNDPLSPNYARSYSICWYPESEVHVVDAGN